MTVPASPTVSLAEATRAWARIAIHSFGGPAGQIATIHRVVVAERGWLTEAQFLHALGYCMLLPGPEAQQLVTYAGWRLHGVRGGLIAGSLFILPGFVAILALSIGYATFGQVAAVAAIFAGLKPAVFAIVMEALNRLGKRALPDRWAIGFAAAAFLGIFAFGVPFPVIIAVAGLAGASLGRQAGSPLPPEPAGGPPPEPRSRPSIGSVARTVALWLAVWFLPVIALLAVVGRDHILIRLAAFFSQTAVVTFGGAYSVLAYVAQEAVATFGWLSPAEMLDGLGLAETTPGPLIMVLQFVGYLAASRGMDGSPILAGVAGSVVTTWVTFAPCFLFVFAGAPYLEWLRGHRVLSAALAGIMAAVVGVVLNLTVWFALHVLFSEVTLTRIGPAELLVPRWSSIDLTAAFVATAALIAVFRFRIGMFPTLALGAGLGLISLLLGR
ncbi:MAG: chromate efflux transporter [Gemmatimonadales bacterium]